MASDPADHQDLAASGVTIPSDSENYSAHNDRSPSPPLSSTSPLILYSPPTVWGLLRGTAINLLLPFINGLMLGFGELLAHEAAFRLGWSGTKVQTLHSLIFSIILNVLSDRSSLVDEPRGRLVQALKYEETRAQASGKRTSRTLMQ